MLILLVVVCCSLEVWFFRKSQKLPPSPWPKAYIIMGNLLALAYQGQGQGRILVFRFIIEYSSLRDFYRPLGNTNTNNNNRSILFFNLRIFERIWYFGLCWNLRLSYYRVINNFLKGFWFLLLEDFFWGKIIYFLHVHNE